MKQKGILVWDCTACQSKEIEFIQKLQKSLKTVFSSIVISAEEPATIPSQVSDLAITTSVTIRYGKNAIRDVIVDTLAYINEAKGRCSVAVITQAFPLWISLFQRVSVKSVALISGKNPRDCIEFSFLPAGINLSILQWPNLEAVSSSSSTVNEESSDEESTPSPARKTKTRSPVRQIEEKQPEEEEVIESDQPVEEPEEVIIPMEEEDYPVHEEEQEDENLYDVDVDDELLASGDDDDVDILEEEEVADDSLHSQSSFNTSNNDSTGDYRRGRQGFGGSIQPLSNLDKYQIDLRSPVVSANTSRLSESGNVDLTPKRPSAVTTGRDQVFEVPAKFQPLMEAMRAMNKAMISLSDLEGQLKHWGAKLGEPIDNVNAYICKASDQQIIIYDKSINYVRFRNRAMSTGKIHYV